MNALTIENTSERVLISIDKKTYQYRIVGKNNPFIRA
jgi:hypothetical protein